MGFLRAVAKYLVPCVRQRSESPPAPRSRRRKMNTKKSRKLETYKQITFQNEVLIAEERCQHSQDIDCVRMTVKKAQKKMKERSTRYEEVWKRYRAQLTEEYHHYMTMQKLALEVENARKEVKEMCEHLISGYEALIAAERHVPLHDNGFELEQGLQEGRLNQYRLIKILGEGSFGKVMLANRKSVGGLGSGLEPFAIKSVLKEDVRHPNCGYHIFIEKEVFICALGHPFLLQLHSCFQTKERLYYVMEYLPGGDMYDMWLQNERTLSEKTGQFYAAEITLAVDYLHRCGIVHRDIKFKNILLDKEGHCKLADFGLCEIGILDGLELTEPCGTLPYMAPEMLQELKYGPEVDWWAVGVLMYELMVGEHPFESPGTSSFWDKILHNPVQYPRWLSSNTVSILQGFLTKDPAQRLGAHGDTDAIRKHPFHETTDWEGLLEKRVEPPWKPQITEITDVGPWNNFDCIREESVPAWHKTACADLRIQEAYRGFSFVNSNYGAEQCQAYTRSTSQHFHPRHLSFLLLFLVFILFFFLSSFLFFN